MIQIKKSKAGFRVRHLGKNNEVLCTSEVLKTKVAAFKNVAAMIRLYDKTNMQAVDETGTIWGVWADGSKSVLAEPKKKK